MDSVFISKADMGDAKVIASIRKNERVAREAMQLIARRYKKLPPAQAFEAITNTIGILAVEQVRGGQDVLGDDLAGAVRDIIARHMDRHFAIKQTRGNHARKNEFVKLIQEVHTMLSQKRPRIAAPALAKTEPLPNALHHGPWTPERDAAIIKSKGCYRTISEYADIWGLSIQHVISRWHRLRVG